MGFGHRAVTLAGAMLAIALSGCIDQAAGGGAGSRDQIRAVGSSTVFPFTTAVAEHFVNGNPQFASPTIESTGTGAGVKLFCAGIGARFPDIVDASRRLKASEFADCAANNVREVMEVQVGIDGVALAENNDGPRLQLTSAHVYRALAATPYGRAQTARRWSDVDPRLPAVPIKVYGPPATSGTRDALVELILTAACEEDPRMAALKDADEDAFRANCTRIREDGAYVDSGENDNLIVQKLAENPNAVGIFGYSFLEENTDRLHGVPIDGVAPTYDTIASGRYPASRPLYIYVKRQHLRAIPGLQAFLDEYEGAWGPDGYLARRGLIAAPAPVRQRAAEVISDQRTLTASDLG